jgi:transcriptional regulator with XRE-family HTH domain
MHPLLHLLRAARYLLGLTQAHVDEACKFTARTVFKLEAGKHARLPRTAFTLKVFYESRGIEFVDAQNGHGAGIRWRQAGVVDPVRSTLFRAARGLADLSQESVAIQANIDETFVNRLEKDALKQINEDSLRRVEVLLNAKNVEITPETAHYGAGVRWIESVES